MLLLFFFFQTDKALSIEILSSPQFETLSLWETFSPHHFAHAALKVFGVLRMQSLLPQCTEQWYAWVFL